MDSVIVTDVIEESDVSKRRETRLSKHELEKIRREKLKLAAYCPKVSGCSWNHGDPRKNSH